MWKLYYVLYITRSIIIPFLRKVQGIRNDDQSLSPVTPLDIFLPNWQRGQPAALDVTVISTLQQSPCMGLPPHRVMPWWLVLRGSLPLMRWPAVLLELRSFLWWSSPLVAGATRQQTPSPRLAAVRACMEIGKTGSSGVVEWFPTVHDSFFPVRECLESENLALLTSHSAAKLLYSYHSICTVITISCVINKNRLTSSSVKGQH